MIYLFKASKTSRNGETYRILAVTGQDPYYILQCRLKTGIMHNWLCLCQFSHRKFALANWRRVMALEKRQLREVDYTNDCVPF